ncbi:hypothetical protein L1987_67237 [Smallanthus sonchifolius]|uniref:Uncharacterized protein n=1 Tax=Smallanthus sonchifolius TaxID=185202 RepID=A0ACB9BZJ2_9ASTR|nr:hypothetical protein L1987_67237 [Smallanthus sonchifolius]
MVTGCGPRIGIPEWVRSWDRDGNGWGANLMAFLLSVESRIGEVGTNVIAWGRGYMGWDRYAWNSTVTHLRTVNRGHRIEPLNLFWRWSEPKDYQLCLQKPYSIWYKRNLAMNMHDWDDQIGPMPVLKSWSHAGSKVFRVPKPMDKKYDDGLYRKEGLKLDMEAHYMLGITKCSANAPCGNSDWSSRNEPNFWSWEVKLYGEKGFLGGLGISVEIQIEAEVLRVGEPLDPGADGRFWSSDGSDDERIDKVNATHNNNSEGYTGTKSRKGKTKPSSFLDGSTEAALHRYGIHPSEGIHKNHQRNRPHKKSASTKANQRAQGKENESYDINSDDRTLHGNESCMGVSIHTSADEGSMHGILGIPQSLNTTDPISKDNLSRTEGGLHP